MNTNQLKKMAAEARQQLIHGITARLHYVRSTDSTEIREQERTRQELERALEREGEAALVERIAYTWFNRLVALRFMDLNDYQPGGIRVISPREGFTRPQLLEVAQSGQIPQDLPVDTQLVNDLLDGRRPSKNAENEVYRLLLMAACNQLHQTFPFLFEPLSDYTELLLPEDVISAASILHLIREGLPAEDCQEVEVLGWLYQFYISEENQRLIGSKKKYSDNELAPASQLFTPKWIVQYIVDNTLGHLWYEMRPDSKLIDRLSFFIKPDPSVPQRDRKINSIEEITFLDPCVGSGHILSYAYDVFFKMYEEEGYAPSEVPELILTKNLFGSDIDDRATQIASFVLMMKGRKSYRRFFRKEVKPNIVVFSDIPENDHYKHASAIGSLLKPSGGEKGNDQINSLFEERQEKAKRYDSLLSQKYDLVVTNPPYVASKRMPKHLKDYTQTFYPATKSDLFATFVLRCLELCKPGGLTGFMTPFVWMFISSYEKFRQFLIKEKFINNLIQLEYSGFDGATVPICTFTLRNEQIPEGKGNYIRLSDFKGPKVQAPKTLEAIQNPNCGWFYTARQRDFGKIPGSPVGYWLGRNQIETLEKVNSLNNEGETRRGLQPGNSERFTRIWHEINFRSFGYPSYLKTTNIKWYVLNSGGVFRKWYGNLNSTVNWHSNGKQIKETGKAIIPSEHLYLKKAIVWNKITSGKLAFRFQEDNIIPGDASPAFFPNKQESLIYILGLLNSKVISPFLAVFTPTLNAQVGDIRKLPVVVDKKDAIESLVRIAIKISINENSSFETSWSFTKNELIRTNGNAFSECFDHYSQHWKEKFHQLHQTEEALNRQFIEIYGLQEELTPDVPLADITILQQELDQKKLDALSADYRSGWQLQAGKWILEQQRPYPELPFDQQEIMAQFVSYAVGAMFGRYSLDKEGLILANQGEDISDFVRKVTGEWWVVSGDGEWKLDPDKDVYAHYPELQNSQDTTNEPPPTTHQKPSTNHHPLSTTHHPPLTFWPDEDNIIPVLDEEWFEDDIVSRFRVFLRASFGEEHFHENLAFLEECLGTDIRSWFVKKFYSDHIKRYKKRPIYWLMASPSGAFQALIYLHRYTPDTMNHLLNDYLRVYMDKLRLRLQELAQVELDPNASAGEQSRARKQMDKYRSALDELETWEREVIYPLASERIAIDLDDGVLVNYNKFGQAVQLVSGLNDAKTKKKVRGFDWIDTAGIR